MNTHEKAVIITGAAGGIGQALVTEFSAAGYFIVGIVHKETPLSTFGVQYVTCDLESTVQNDTYASNIFDQVRSHISKLCLKALINNAAVQILADVENLTKQNWKSTLDVNLLAPFFWTQAFLPELESSQGCVLNMSSIHARLTKRSFCAYATSKAALSGMTRALAVDLHGRVRVNAIEPAAIDTDMLRAGFEDNPNGLQQLAGYHPSGALGNPHDLANFARSVVELNGGFLNGAVLGFDGGISGCLSDPDTIKTY